MNSIKPQGFFIILCLFLSFQAQNGLGMNMDSIENPTETTSNLSLQDRKLATVTGCYSQSCQQSGSLGDEDSSYDYQIAMGTNSKMTFQFTVGTAETQLELSLVATPAANMKTTFKLVPSDSWPNYYMSTISGANWNRDLTIESDSSSRVLIIEIINDSSSQSTTVRFGIEVDEIDSSQTWLAPVVSVVVVGAVVFFVICICCRIRRRILLRRRRRAQAAYEVALANAQAEANNENNQLMDPQAAQNQHHIVQIIQVPAQNNQNYPLAPSIEMMPRDQNNPNTGPLNKDNFDQRFPERAGRMFKSSFPQKTCSICLEDLGKLEKCRQLYCEHIFHSECVKLWLLNQVQKQNNGFCPNCNKKMTFVVEKVKQDV